MGRAQLGSLTYFNSTATSVVTEDIKFDANIFNVSLPLTGVDTGNLSISLLGKSRITTINGQYVGTEANILNFRSEIEDEMNSTAQDEKTYTATDGGTFDVLITKSTFRRDLSSPEVVTFSIELLTSNQILG